MVSFPEDIIIDILSKLPVKTIIRFKCVRKSWYNLIKNPIFVKLQHKHSLEFGNPGVLYNHAGQICCVDYDSSSSTLSNTVVRVGYPSEYRMKDIIGSCNGLVCYESHQNDFIIWNPYTKDYKKIPTPPETDPEFRYSKKLNFHIHGFGYDSKTEDYMLARLVHSWKRSADQITVYSLKFNMWNIVKTGTASVTPYKDLVLFEGILYWLGRRFNSEKAEVICSFDIGNNAFKEIKLPQRIRKKFDRIYVCPLGGCLYLIGSRFNASSKAWMIKDYGVHESWTKNFSVENSKKCTFVDLRQYYRNGVILTQENDYHYYLYEPDHEEATKNKVAIDSIPPGFKTWQFFGSLVSPN